MKTVNPKWLKAIKEKYAETRSVDVTEVYLPAVQELIKWLSEKNIDYRVYNVGAGVRRVTTQTTICPCCMRKL